MTKYISIIMLTLFCLAPTPAAEGSEDLLKVTQLHTSAVGYAGTESDTYKLFKAQLERGREAIPVFQECLEKGTPAARLYGAIGLKKIDPKLGNPAFQSLLKDDGKVTIMQGCILHEASVNDLARELLSDDPNTLSVKAF